MQRNALKNMKKVIERFGLLITLLGSVGVSHAAEITIAVASNFRTTAEAIVGEFEVQTKHHVVIISGSTGKLYAQIMNRAPFHILLAADTKRPQLLINHGTAIEDTAFVYAVGQLTLWSPNPNQAIDGLNMLHQGGIRHIAIANPKTAPYGQAAYEVLRSEGLWASLQPRIVQGENIGQAFQFVSSGNADFGFVALSQILDPQNRQTGSHWAVPQGLYTPVEQAAVLLKYGQAYEPAKAFLHFLREPFARQVIQQFGYGLKD